MRPVFTEEVARELGYQEYWPEKMDWVIGTVAVLLGSVIFMGLMVGAVMLIKYK